MSEQIEQPKTDASNEPKSVAGPAAMAAASGLVLGTLAAGPVLGIALALIWGIQAAACAASGHKVDSNDVS
jgi:Zn-dependent protease